MSDTPGNQPINLEDVKLKLYERLKPSGWADKLKAFMLSDDFGNILQELYKQSQAGQRFTPQIKQLLRAFEACPYDKLKVVMLGQDPYPQPGTCDGLAFSCSNLKYVQPSLKFIFQELEDTVYKGQSYSRDPDLTRWADQGVLLINTALTTTVGQVGQHYLLWRPFIAFLFDMLNWYNPGIVYVYLGKKAQEWSDAVSDNNHKIMVSHPAAAAHTRAERWDSKNLFGEINRILEGTGSTKVIW